MQSGSFFISVGAILDKNFLLDYVLKGVVRDESRHFVMKIHIVFED